MEIIKPYVELEFITPNALHLIEKAGRTCYKSEDKITQDSAAKFCKMIQTRDHMSVLEHASATFRIVCDRGVSHEIVRHRLASYSQESTRYCCYSPDKKGMKFIQPSWISDEDLAKEINRKSGEGIAFGKEMAVHVWYVQCEIAESRYDCLVSECGCTPQQARAVLPNCLKTELVMTANFREWLHFLELRTSPQAHPDMRWIAQAIQTILWGHYPQIFRKASEENV